MLIWDILKQMGGEYMNYEKVGSVIYQLRKEAAMTQQEISASPVAVRIFPHMGQT